MPKETPETSTEVDVVETKDPFIKVNWQRLKPRKPKKLALLTASALAATALVTLQAANAAAAGLTETDESEDDNLTPEVDAE